MSYSNKEELVKQFFFCKIEEEDEIIQLMPKGNLVIKLTKAQKKAWSNSQIYLDALDALEKEEARKEKERAGNYAASNLWKDALRASFAIIFGAGGGLLTLFGAIPILYLPMLIPGAIFLGIAGVGLITSLVLPIWNWFALEKARKNAKELAPDYILKQKLKKLIQCGKFTCIDFSAQDPSLWTPSNFAKTNMINPLANKQNCSLLINTFQNPIKIKYSNEDSYVVEAKQWRDTRIQMNTNYHYNQGLSFFSLLKRTELSRDAIGTIIGQWLNLPGLTIFPTENLNHNIKHLLVSKLSILNGDKIKISEKNTTATSETTPLL
jgi:hypothetical protein